MSPKFDSDTPKTEDSSQYTIDEVRPLNEVEVYLIDDVESLSSEEGYSSYIDSMDDDDFSLHEVLIEGAHIRHEQEHPIMCEKPANCDDVPKLKESNSNPVTLYNIDLSKFSRSKQFALCVSALFCFTVTYSYLQELITVHILDRKLPLFLAAMQFFGYTLWSSVLYAHACSKKQKTDEPRDIETEFELSIKPRRNSVSVTEYALLATLRAMDFVLTNHSMHYLNYPAKTLLKSSRVIFTMLIGVIIARKKYCIRDYTNVLLLVSGLTIFLHADASSNALFNPIGVFLLGAALICDGTVSNWTEVLMNRYSVGHDEFLFRLYSLCFVVTAVVAHVTGELEEGFMFLFSSGKLGEAERTEGVMWTPVQKISVLALFSFVGLLGSSAAAAITKNFGAFLMSLTSTTRKAFTVFLSFALFRENKCTLEHGLGIIIFVSSLLLKSFRLSTSNESFTEKKKSVLNTNMKGITIDVDYGQVPQEEELKVIKRRNKGKTPVVKSSRQLKEEMRLMSTAMIYL